MKISFLVTYYEQAQYVEQSLNSILEIKKPCDWEILVGDDGSSDNTVDIVNGYIEKYPDNIKLFVMPREAGKKYAPIKRASENRINLLEHAEGDIFCTLDGDDRYVDKDFVGQAVELFEQNDNISVVCFAYADYVNEVPKKTHKLPKKVGCAPVDKQAYMRFFYIHAGACVHKLIRSSVPQIKKAGFFDDNDIVLNSLKHGEMYYIDKTIYAYRQTGDGIFTSMDSFEQAVLNVLGCDADIKIMGEEYRDIMLQRYAYAIMTAYLRKNSVKELLGDKYTRYIGLCGDDKKSLCRDILTYSELNAAKKDELDSLINTLKKQNRLLYAAAVLKNILRGFIK
ncbi:MAG: glycosyltransferase family 2 protein [Firmicutes bacterium]|nr:glycosyltransferase family 2 protein [Bacillota bacterium]MBQ9519264.1 glycosyltransferase family 2 protein [Bacillota bacterium]